MIRTLSILAMGLLAFSYPAFAQTKGNIQDLMKRIELSRRTENLKLMGIGSAGCTDPSTSEAA